MRGGDDGGRRWGKEEVVRGVVGAGAGGGRGAGHGECGGVRVVAWRNEVECRVDEFLELS